MRTVALGNITQALIDTLADASKTPYIRIYINGTDYSSRLEYLEHHEEPYRERAVIGLHNRDGALDGIDLDGYSFEVGYGYDSSGHAGSTTDYVNTATLWVKQHCILSVRGNRIYQIYAEGMWMLLREQKILPGFNAWKASTTYVQNQVISPTTANGHMYQCTTPGTSGGAEPSWPQTSDATVTDGAITWTEVGTLGDYPAYSATFNRTHTIEQLAQMIVESVGFTWTAVSDSDGIIDVFTPVFDMNQIPFESGASAIYRLLWMTKEYIRCKPSTTMECVYPQDDDTPDINYYSGQYPQFDEYDEKSTLLIPNSIIVLCNQDPSGDWDTDDYPIIVGTASDSVQISKYREVVHPYMAGSINNQADANLRSAAILTRLRAEILGGRMTLSWHDPRLELYDKIQVNDTRILS